MSYQNLGSATNAVVSSSPFSLHFLSWPVSNISLAIRDCTGRVMKFPPKKCATNFFLALRTGAGRRLRRFTLKTCSYLKSTPLLGTLPQTCGRLPIRTGIVSIINQLYSFTRGLIGVPLFGVGACMPVFQHIFGVFTSLTHIFLKQDELKNYTFE